MAYSGWFWLAAAFLLGAAETILPGFILLGFGIGAFLTGIALFLGLPHLLAWLLLVFAVSSALGWYLLRRFFALPGQRPRIWKKDINDN